MDKREIYDSLDKTEAQTQDISVMLGKIKKELTQIIEKNAELEIENQHLRERLQELEQKNSKEEPGLSKSRQNLEKLYREGFHVCNDMYGSRRVNDEPCIFCQGVIYGERH
ncbi:DNA replication initiation control protein YabA [Ligilactobacillus sp. WILCCON 0076]|uniref:Replication initiation control protein YabA n=1 Tax=Ligilactobacillus ubinensis TaxID=2876789 RepID=A0A9X2FI36_9LACO|nr:DNA replication initiation control protein YabA [Ligilactobacillus ubinensis]MCP0886382.1 DNA replication initiation control protein YabA [Ligilactobacillus ubinensis]